MKKLLPIILIVITLGICIIILVKSNPQYIVVTTIPTSYNSINLQEDEDYLDVIIYLDYKDSYYTKKENIISSTLYDDEVMMKVQLHSIDYLEKHKIGNKNFYAYNFRFKVVIGDNQELVLKNARLELCYSDVENIDIYIGSIYFFKAPFYFDETNIVEIKEISGIVNEVDGIKTLVGMYLKIRCTDIITIKDIRLVDANNYFSLSEVVEVEEINANDNMNELLGYSYDYCKGTIGTIDMTLQKGEKGIVIPIKTIKTLSRTGFIITYMYDGNLYNYYYNDFIFFKDLEISNNLQKKLEYYSYDFN